VGTSVGRRVRDKLTDRQVRGAKLPGYYGDGAGLYLQISPAGTRSWIFRFTLSGRSREMGLGPYPDVPLSRAREKRDECRALLAEGTDPLEARRAARRTAESQAARAVTFKAEAEAYIEAHRAGWKNAKHAEQWTNTLETYAYPFIGKHLVGEIDTALVMKCLQPIWTTKTETASRVRGRIESVLDYATALKHRTGDNPARWRGHLDNLLPNPSKVAKTENHAALPYAKVGAFLKTLRAGQGTSALAVEFIVLTAARTSEATNASWGEMDLERKVWTVPADRMKAGREHRVPLSDAAVKVLQKMRELQTTGYVFPGAKDGRPLSNMTGLKLLQRIGYGDFTVHGFRSSFRDWAAEQTNFPREVAEMALAHTIKDGVEAAYRRGDLYEKRAKLMQAWAEYCGKEAAPATVTPIRKNRADIAKATQ
jgi:integrase